MVRELLDQEEMRPDIQVTGKVSLTTANSSNNISVIRRSPDSPDSGNEDSAWFLREVLQRSGQDHQQEQNSEESRKDVSPLTPATSPTAGHRRSGLSESESESSSGVLCLEVKPDLVNDSSDNESKRARVETIVSSMRSSSAINGCKKRKLYQPQQHDSARYGSADEEEDDEEESHSAAKNSCLTNDFQQEDPLRSLQDRIASLQQRSLLQQSPVSQSEVRRPVRDDVGRGRHSQNLNNGAARPDLSHLSQAHAAYIDATRRLLVEQQQQRQQQQQQQQQQARSAQPSPDLEGLAEMLKTELASSLAQLIDTTLSRFAAQQRRNSSKACDEEVNKQRARVIDRGLRNGDITAFGLSPFLRTPYLPHLFPHQSTTALSQLASNIGTFGNLPLNSFGQQPQQPAKSPVSYTEQENGEQNEALSLVVSPKKRCVKVSDGSDSPLPMETNLSPVGNHNSSANSPPPSRSPTPPAHYMNTQHHRSQPSLLHHPNLFSPYSAYFAAAAAGAAAAAAVSRSKSPESSSPPLNSASLLHPALLASHPSAHLRHHDLSERNSDSSDIVHYEGGHQMSTLTPMHLRKAKLMFFWTRYPSSSVLKTYFPDVKFNKNNTAQLVKWFSNFREFYYIQMEKYARQLLNEGLVNAEDIHISTDSELFRVLNQHYNRNNHIEPPPQFVIVVTQTMREFFNAIQTGKDAEPSWKKAIYKIIARLDEPVPEYFRTPNFLEHLE